MPGRVAQPTPRTPLRNGQGRAGQGLNEESEVLALGIKLKEAPKTSVIKVNDSSMWYFLKIKMQNKKIRDE